MISIRRTGDGFHPGLFKYALGVGVLIAAVIEVSQLVLARGLFEWDDMIHNGLGCMAGCVLRNWVRRFLAEKMEWYHMHL